MIYKSYVLRSIQYDTIAYIILNQNKCSNMSEKKVLELNIQIQNSGHTMRLREIKHEFYRWNTKKKQNRKKQIFKYYIQNDKKYRPSSTDNEKNGVEQRKKISKLCHEIWKIDTFEWNRSPNCHQFAFLSCPVNYYIRPGFHQ